MGRPSNYNPDIAKEICDRLALGETLKQICDSGDRFPAISTVCLWNLDNREGFAELYARARRAQAELMADEILSIADDATNDFMEISDKKGNVRVVPDMESQMRSRLRVDTRKWYLSKVLPKIYGDKLVHQGDESAPLVVRHIGKPSE